MKTVKHIPSFKDYVSDRVHGSVRHAKGAAAEKERRTGKIVRERAKLHKQAKAVAAE